MPFFIKRAKTGLCILCVLLCVSVPRDVLGINDTQLDLGASITRIKITEFEDIYVGGVNFVAQLTFDLQLLFNISIGPVTDEAGCFPLPAPCDNVVRVLEIDTVLNRLLVCGTAYQGTCTSHELFQITLWNCLAGSTTEDGAAILTGWNNQNTVLHFLNHTLLPVGTSGPVEPNFNIECRSLDFGLDSFQSEGYGPAAARSRTSSRSPGQRPRKRVRNRIDKSSFLRSNFNEDIDLNGEDVDEGLGPAEEEENQREGWEPDGKILASTLIIAGNVYNAQTPATNSMLLSIRHVTFSGTHYNINYAQGQNGRPVGLDVKPELKSSFFIDYKLSFSWGQFSYFVYLQEEKNCEDRESPCIVTKISRTCHDPSNLLPYVEVPLYCKHEGKTYSILTSAVLGTVGLRLTNEYETVPILMAAFGNGTQPKATTPDAKYGAAVCAFPLLNMEKQDFSFALDLCNNGIPLMKPVTWIAGSPQNCYYDSANDVCSPNTKNPYVQNSKLDSSEAVFFDPGVSVVTILTHSQTVKVGGELKPSEKMTVYLLTGKGQLDKFSLQVKKHSQYLIETSHVTPGYHNLEGPISPQGYQPVGSTDHTRAITYFSYGQKIVGLSLDFCRQYQTCRKCGEEGDCRWCPAENACHPEETVESTCPGATETTCPPLLTDFTPKYVPKEGGSTLKLSGENLGSTDDGQGIINVTVCGQPCEDIVAKVNSITCEVSEKCETCSDICNITVVVKDEKDSDGTTSSFNMPGRPVLHYVTPEITSFSPKFGPAFGGTALTFEGQNVKVGSSTRITVAGAECLEYNQSPSLKCHIEADEYRRADCGKVTVSIDNFVHTIDSEEFCFRANPVATEVRPMSTIESGGVTITVIGYNLDSVSSPILKLLVSYDDAGRPTPDLFTSVNCTLHDRAEKLTCKTPNVKRATRNRSPNDDVIGEMRLDMDGVDLLNASGLSGKIIVYRDPALYELTEGADLARITPTKKTFVIFGDNIPTWIDENDINITIGNTTCDVLAIAPGRISCDGKKALQMARQDFLDSGGEDKDADGGDGGGAWLTSSSARPNETSSTETTTISVSTSIFENSTEFPVEPTPTSFEKFVFESPFLDGQVAMALKASENNTDTFMNVTRPSSPSTSPDFHQVTTTTIPRPTRAIKYIVTVRIGNYEKVLGYVLVGPHNENESWVDEDADDPETAGLDFKLIAGASGAGLLLVILVIVACVMSARARKARRIVKEQAFYMGSLSGSQHGSKEAATPSLKQILESVMEPHKRTDMDRLIISLDRLTVGKSIGSGNFGCVYEGLLSSDPASPAEKVAVKTLQDTVSHNIDLHAFVQEAVIMKDFQHPHVLGLVGLAEKEPGVPYVILPYMDNGDLLTFIRDPSVSLSLHDVIKFGADIASGMAYLSALKFVHRDLAARNCMLDSLYRVKVADFGLCRDIYEKGYYTSDNRKKLPIRWMAIESIEHGAYSTKSDVWSLGVVLWEMLTRGVTPYPGVDGWDVINFLRHRRLAPPCFCPDELYTLMMKCWAKDPNLRPPFTNVQAELLQMIGQTPSLTDTLTATLKRSAASLAASSHSVDKVQTTAGKPSPAPIKPKPMPRIRISKADKLERNEQNVKANSEEHAPPARDASKETDNSVGGSTEGREGSPTPNVVSGMIKNIMITIPACYSHRDVSKAAAGAYIQLVDNYEPPPKFSNPLLRAKKKSKQKSLERRTAEKKTREAVKSTDSGYIVPRSSTGSVLRDETDGACRSSAGSLAVPGSKDGNYYVLETTSLRSSGGSDIDSHSGRSSSMLNNTGSLASALDSRCSSSYSNSRASGASSVSATRGHRGSTPVGHSAPFHMKSPLATPARNPAWEDVSEHSEGTAHDENTFL